MLPFPACQIPIRLHFIKERRELRMGRRRRVNGTRLSPNQASSCRCVIEALIRAPIAIVVEAAFSSQLIEMLDGSFAEPFHVFLQRREAR